MNNKRQYQQPLIYVIKNVRAYLLDSFSTTLGTDTATSEGRAGETSLWDEEEVETTGNGSISSGLDDDFN